MPLSKITIRQQQLNWITTVKPALHKTASHAICNKLLSIFGYYTNHIIASYKPIGNEINPTQYTKQLQKNNTIVFAHINNYTENNMQFYEAPNNKFEKNTLGFLQPTTHNLTPQTPTVVIVPIIAFNQQAYRIGRGKGYYDKTLAKLKHLNPNLTTIGLAYQQNYQPFIPESHDFQLNFIITQTQVFIGQPCQTV